MHANFSSLAKSKTISMTKEFATYSIYYFSQVNGAQILFYAANGTFVGRIDFVEGATCPKDYLWQPAYPNGDVYLVLFMPLSKFAHVVDLLRNEGPWVLELSPKSQLNGFSVEGRDGRLCTKEREKTGEGELNVKAVLR
jgi:hypothetical protein